MLRLGEATFAAAAVGSHMLDLLRTHCGRDSWDLSPNTHGALLTLLEQRVTDVPGLADLLPELLDAVALVARSFTRFGAAGLRYRSRDRSVTNFHDISDLGQARDIFLEARVKANRALWARQV